MSLIKWMNPDINKKISNLICGLSSELKYNYYIFCLCYYKLNYYLPQEIHKNILIYLLGTKNYNFYDVLNWWDNYIENEYQKQNNPILFNGKIDIFYDFFEADLNYISKNYYWIFVPQFGDLVCGIIKNNNIKNINFQIFPDIDIKLNSKDLFEFKLNILENQLLKYEDNIFGHREIYFHYILPPLLFNQLNFI